MNDFLLQNVPTRRIIRSLGLPIGLPENLKRADGPYVERCLAGRKVAVGGALDSHLSNALAGSLSRAGATLFVSGGGSHSAYQEAAEAYAERLSVWQDEDLDAAIFDASSLQTPSDLEELHRFFQPRIQKLSRSGRALVVAPPSSEAKQAATAATRRALLGFCKSLAKELGRRGSTVQLISVEAAASDRLEPCLRWLLSPRSAFVTGQELRLSDGVLAPNQSPMTRPFEGKTAVVTGAARGIGKATACLLAQEGARVLCLDRKEDDTAVSQLARSIQGEALLCDVRQADAAEQIAQAAKGRVDILIHNAGVTRDKTLGRMKPEQWQQAVDINLGAVVQITEALEAGGHLADEARIVCLSSVAGIAGNVGQCNYAASKAGIIGMVEHLSTRLAPRGITVNAIAPGFIETRLTAAIPVMIREAGRRLAALSQGGQPGDVAEAIAFLSTPGASGISGQVLRVCGGALIGA
jgi:3-oxoacyl-[acyl-carrier protein] reductase